MDLFLFEKLAVARLRQRCMVDENGLAHVRVDRDGAVTLPAEEWEALGARFHAAIKPSASRLRWSVPLAIPFDVAEIMLMKALPPLGAFFDQAVAAFPNLTLMLFFSGLPLAAMIAHMLTVQREIDRTLSLLALHPRQRPTASPSNPALKLLDLAAIVFIGPHVLIQVYGTLVPDAYRNTPWTGARLDWTGWAGLAVLAALIALRVLAPGKSSINAEAGPATASPLGKVTAVQDQQRAPAFGRKKG